MGGEVEMLKGRVPSMKVGDVTLAQVDVLVSGKLKVSLMGVDTLHRLGATHLSLQLT
jgi:predicted aspartyl protease